MEVGESEKRGKSEIFAGRNGTSQKVNFPKRLFASPLKFLECISAMTWNKR